MIRTIIIDDEENAVKLLVMRLSQHCPYVRIVAACTDSREGIDAIQQHKPDLVFLDIEMPLVNGFEVLNAVSDIQFSLVFVTAYDRFAIKAFKYSALDYLLKPIDTHELIESVRKAEKQQTFVRQVEHLQVQYETTFKTGPDRLALPYQNGVTFVDIQDILYCEADDNYTRFVLQNGQTHIAARTLRDVHELLEDRDFVRIHRQHLVNIKHVKKFVRGDGSYVVMNNGQTLTVSRGQKDRLMERFGWV